MNKDPLGWPDINELSRIVNDISNGAPQVSWTFTAKLPRLSKMIREMYGDWKWGDPKIEDGMVGSDKEWHCPLRLTLIPFPEKGYIGLGITTEKFDETSTIFTGGIPFNKPPFTARLREMLETFEHGLRGDS